MISGGKDLSKTALVTGGAGGIGAGIVRALAADGWYVYINYNKSQKAAFELAQEVGGQAVKGDVRDFVSVSEMFQQSGPVDFLVNNAGVSHYGVITGTSIMQWKELFAVNVDGVFHCTQCVLPHMIEQKQGIILNISSVWGMVGASCEVAYSATKSAVIGLSKSMAKELGPSNIRVNCIAPGVVHTDMLEDLSDEDIYALKAQTPLGTIGKPEDIGSLAAFLASPGARFITGQVISPNGGFVI